MKDKLTYLIVALLVISGAGLIYSGLQTGGQDTKSPGPIVDEGKEVRPAPDFTAETLDGKEVSLSGFKGRPLYLYFGASW